MNTDDEVELGLSDEPKTMFKIMASARRAKFWREFLQLIGVIAILCAFIWGVGWAQRFVCAIEKQQFISCPKK